MAINAARHKKQASEMQEQADVQRGSVHTRLFDQNETSNASRHERHAHKTQEPPDERRKAGHVKELADTSRGSGQTIKRIWAYN